jgi:hypothetical protein
MPQERMFGTPPANRKPAMHDIQKITKSLKRLNDLEARPSSVWVGALTERERRLAVERARQGLPTALLGHHDRMIARGKRSLATVRNGVCGACHIRLPIGHRRGAVPGGDLDVCDNCGVFIEWEVPAPVPPPHEPLVPTVRRRPGRKKQPA